MEVGEGGKTGEAQSFILHRPLRRWRVERVHPYPRVYTAKCWSTPIPRVYAAKSAGPPLPSEFTRRNAGPPLSPEFTRRKVLVHPYPPSLHGEKCWSTPTPPSLHDEKYWSTPTHRVYMVKSAGPPLPPPPSPEFTWRAVLAHP